MHEKRRQFFKLPLLTVQYDNSCYLQYYHLNYLPCNTIKLLMPDVLTVFLNTDDDDYNTDTTWTYTAYNYGSFHSLILFDF